MALQKQMYSIPFTGVLDEKASDKHLQPPKLDICDNGKFSKNGQVQKRNGFTRLANTSFIGGSASTVGASVQCASYRDEKLIFDGNNAYTRSASGTWVDKGRITGCTFKDTTAFNNDAMTSGQLAAASANGYRVESWAETDTDTAIVPFLATSITYQIYTRVVDEATGVVVVPKTRITPAAGIVVTKAHAQNDDSNYLNPQVQAVTMGDYVFVLFCDCQQHDPKVNVTSISAGSGTIRVNCDAAHNYLYQDVITLAGSTGYDGNYIVTAIDSATGFQVAASFSATGTGTSTVKQTYSSGMVNGVHAIAINTANDIAAGLTPTALANFNSPAFYVNGVYPLFSVAYADNSTTSAGTEKAAVFRFNTAPINDAAATVPSYRLDYFEEASGVFQEWEDTQPGYRGRNTPILPADRVAYFQASKAGHSDTDRTLSHIALNAIDADDRLMIAATFEESGTPTNPEVRVKMYTDSLGTTGAAVTDLAQSSQCLISGSFLKQLTGTDLQFVWTGQAITEGSAVAPDSGQAADHALWKGEITTTGTVKSQIIVKHFTTLTSDLFSYNGKIYFGATYAITPNASFYSGGGDFTFVNFLSSINLISDTDGNIIATGGTGLAGNCASTDWLPNAVDDRTMFWNVGRVTAISASKFSFGSAKFSGVSEGGNAVYQAKSIFNPSYSEIDFLPARNLPAAEGSGSLLLCGGLLWEYGGDSMKENGFLTYPQATDVISSYAITAVGDAGGGKSVFQINTTTPHGLEVGDTVEITGTTDYNQTGAVITAIDNATNTFTIVDAFVSTQTGVVALTGGVLGVGAYTYKIIYEWVGANGDIQRSYPSDGETAEIDAGTVTGTTGRVRLKVYTPQWTQKSLANGVSNPTIVLYRTALGGSTFYRAAAAPVDFSEAGSSSTQTLDDGLIGNSAIEDNEHIYSTGDAGDVFGNIAPPCSTDIVVHKNRVFLAINDGSVWYSKKLAPKRGVEFSDLQVKPIENYAASIACIGAVRDYVVVITAEDAYFLAGEGPNAAGIGTDFSPPTIFSRDSGANIGCARTNSPVGFIYRAKGGIYRVTPSMQVEWIGAPVEDTVDKTDVTRAVVNDSEGEIYFGLNSTTSGILVYNYVFNAWSAWRPRYAAFSSNITPEGMMVHNGTLNFAIPSGYLLEQNTGFTDIGSGTYDFGLLVSTPWLRSEQFLHMVRFYNILISGTFKSNHTLNCTIYSNYDESVTDNQTLAITTSTDDPYIFRQHVANQKARAIKITLSDTPSAGTFESYQLDGIAVEFGVRPGTFKLGTTKTLA